MNYVAIVNEYIKHYRPIVDDEILWFRKQKSLELAIERACLSLDRERKRYSHQRRIKPITLENAYNAMLAIKEALLQCRDFESLYELVGRTVGLIAGAGELYIYDISLRLGVYLDFYPTKVYLHAGSREGAELSDLPRVRST